MRPITSPHSVLTLKIAALGMVKKLSVYEEKNGQGSTKARVEEICVTPEGTFAERAAVFHGITVEQFINSTNYTTLFDEYSQNITTKVIHSLESTFDLTNEEAWALLTFNQIERMDI